MPVLLALGLLTLGGCDGGDETGDDGDASPADPLDVLLGQRLAPTETRLMDLEVENLIGACMRDEGWEYEAVDTNLPLSPLEVDVQLSIDDPETYGGRYGYGAVRFVEVAESGGIEGPPEGPDDPNHEYVSLLSDRERAAYDESLDGEALALGDGGDDLRPLEQQGCRGQARAEVYGVAGSDPAIRAAVEELRVQATETDPDLRAARAAWVTCMGDALDGLTLGADPVTRPSDLRRAFDFALLEARGLDVVSGDPPAGQPVVLTYFGDEGETWTVVGTMATITDRELEQVRQTELDVWAVDWGCRAETELDAAERDVAQRVYEEVLARFPTIEG